MIKYDRCMNDIPTSKDREYKERLTITLSPSILKKVDALIDGQKLRNRSHAIEFILSQHILSRVTKVVILAGGKGTKMRPLTYEFPKAMLPVHDKPLVEHTIQSLVSAGLKDITMVVGHLGSKIEHYFESGARVGARISYVTDLEESGTAQAIASVRRYMATDEPFLLVYGDVLAEVDWLNLIDFHDGNGKLMTMAVTTVTDTEPWGVVSMQGTKIVRFDEKAGVPNGNNHLINSGIYVIDPKVVERITPEMKSFENEVIPMLVADSEVCGYHFSGQWFDVGSANVYAHALKQWKEAP